LIDTLRTEVEVRGKCPGALQIEQCVALLTYFDFVLRLHYVALRTALSMTVEKLQNSIVP
ncbi:MAG: hypothetical protein ABR545_02195, partial [Cyclonatronaceae bacterium]